MTRERSFSTSRLVLLVLVAAVAVAIAVNFVAWLQDLKSEATSHMESHARQVEVRTS